jgi:hypothetical protein
MTPSARQRAATHADYEAGHRAALDGRPLSSNPFTVGRHASGWRAAAWRAGHAAGRLAALDDGRDVDDDAS